MRAGARKGAVLVLGAGSAAAHIARGREVRHEGGGKSRGYAHNQPGVVVAPPRGAAENLLLAAAASLRWCANGRPRARGGGSGAAANEDGRRGRGVGCGFVPRWLRRVVPMRGAQPARLAPRLTQGAGRSPASRRVPPAVVVLRTATKSGRGDAVSLCCLSVRSPRSSAGTAQPHVESPVHRRSARNTAPSGRQAAQRLKVPARPGPSAVLVSRGRDTPKSPGTQFSKVVARLGTPPSRPGPKHFCCARSCTPGGKACPLRLGRAATC